MMKANGLAGIAKSMNYSDIATREDRQFITVCRQFIHDFSPSDYSEIFQSALENPTHPNKALNEATRAVNALLLRQAQEGGLTGSWRDYVPSRGQEAKRVIPTAPPEIGNI